MRRPIVIGSGSDMDGDTNVRVIEVVCIVPKFGRRLGERNEGKTSTEHWLKNRVLSNTR